MSTDQARSSAVGVVSRLLVVTADPALGTAVAGWLALVGTVELCADAEAAVAAFRRRAPDLILLDAAAPHLDPLALLGTVRATDGARDLRVILVGAPGAELAADTAELVDDYVRRPVDGGELITRVRTQLFVARQQAADRRKSDFIAVLSHELRNPLAAIRTNLYVAERAPATDAATRALRVIDRQVGQLARMVDDLLDVTRITQNKMQLRFQRIDLADLVRQTIEDNRSTLERSGVTLDVRFDPGPLSVDADAARIAQIVTNLLANAVKFTPSGGTVSVSVGADASANQAVLRVSDTGIGMDPALLGRLFQPFMQADRTLDRSSGGLGLGLALVKGLVDLHQGDVSASSAGIGRGAELTVRLPLAATMEAGRRPGTAEASPGAGQRVLLIEDDTDVANGLQSALEIDEHQVMVARSGAEGLQAARGYLPDVVLCDIGLPGMNGYDVARAFRSDDALRSTFLVALSGYAQAEDVDRARAAGFDEHIAKPPTIHKLQRIFSASARRTL